MEMLPATSPSKKHVHMVYIYFDDFPWHHLHMGPMSYRTAASSAALPKKPDILMLCKMRRLHLVRSHIYEQIND